MDAHFPAMSDLKAGVEAAWTQAFCSLWPMALSVAQQVGSILTLSEAEEAAADGLQSAMRQIDRLEDVGQFRALVAVVTRRRAISLIREKLAHKRMPGGLPLESLEGHGEEALTPVGSTSDPSSEAMEREMVALLNDALLQLDSFTRRLVREKYLEGCSYEELSAKYQIPVGTLCPKVMRGIQTIRSVLEKSPALLKEMKLFLRR